MTAQRIVGNGGDPGGVRKPVVETPRRPDEVRVLVLTDTDVVTARDKGRAFAKVLGFKSVEATIVAAVVSELARQILRDAGCDEIIVEAVDDGGRHGVAIRVRHEGQGTESRPGDLAQRVLKVGTAGCWRWLDRLERLIHQLEIVSDASEGTIVTIRIWKA